jgi:hypothetical protein
MRGRSAVLALAITVIVGCATPAARPSLTTPTLGAASVPSPLGMPQGSSVSTAPIAPASPAPRCFHGIPAWFARVHHANDGVPGPAGRIVFGVFDHDDFILGQVVAPLLGINPDGSDLRVVLDCQVERPRISHDGTRLAFAIAMDNGTWQVATSAVDGSYLRRYRPDVPGRPQRHLGLVLADDGRDARPGTGRCV